MRKVLCVTAAAVAGLALLSCNRPPPPQRVVYAPPAAQAYGDGPYARADLPPVSPPQTYGSAPYARADVPPPLPPPRTYGGAPYGRADVPPQVPPPRTYGGATYGRADVPPRLPPPRAYGATNYGRTDAPQEDQRLVWKSSPRWATTKSNAKREAAPAKQNPPSKLKLAQAKAAKVGVENLTGEDIEGLSSAELKELRGY